MMQILYSTSQLFKKRILYIFKYEWFRNQELIDKYQINKRLQMFILFFILNKFITCVFIIN